MASPDLVPPLPDARLTGTVREFAAFCTGERQRRLNTEEAFEPVLFDEAVAYVIGKLTAHVQGAAV